MTNELRQLLEENLLGKYIEILERNRINEKYDLQSYTRPDYNRIGITDRDDQDKFLKLFAKKKNSYTGLIIGIIAIIVIVIIIAIILLARKPKEEDISFENGGVNSTEETFGSDEIEKNEGISFNFHGKTIKLTNAGKVYESEKANNINSLSKNDPKEEDISFENGGVNSTEETFGSDKIIKSYAISNVFNIQSAIISDYDLNNMQSDELRNIMIQKSKLLGTVYFPYGTPKAYNSSYNDLSLKVSVLNILAEIPSDMLPYAKFLITGHTDTTYFKNRETDLLNPNAIKFNQELSEERAEYVKKIMQNYGINTNNIVTKGYGYSQLAVEPDDLNHQDNQRLNRRAEIFVVFEN